MPKFEKKDGTAKGAAVLEQAVSKEETGASAPAPSEEVVKYWSPQHSDLIVVTRDGKTFKFSEHRLLVKPDGEADKSLKKASGIGQSYYRVTDGSGDQEYKSKFMGFLRRMITGDVSDTVTTERGIVAIMALFEPDELAAKEIRRSSMDVDAMILTAIETKQVEGII
jgi:hypothetical protein